ncbi:Major facilitator superfamily domain-containing protein 12 [Armadillidium nasatum]|uniref:Major facilitator superfamily domain-containing protein 12 n=1 Tax=Armadillidium nasatum TaxID=96803 RepID=A0A5N5SUY9_9CRUS|nr:Major facilitator superfamily domain-containing protein 12 [Armadillidium nasatum]
MNVIRLCIQFVYRYFFDVTSDVLVYIIAWATFRANGFGGNIDRIDPGDYISFEVTTIFILVIGTFFSLVFHVFTPEASWNPSSEMLPNTIEEDEESLVVQPITMPSSTAEPEDLSLRISMAWRDWVTEPQFYYISLIYTSSRLVANMANIFMPVFLQESANVNQELITIIPLVMSLSGVAASILLKVFRKCASKKASMVIAIMIGFFACSIASVRPLSTYAIYLIAILFGLSSSILIILSLAFTADLIGYCTESSAFVYGSMSFWDKLTNGLVVVVIQELTEVGCDGDNCEIYYKRIVSIGIAVPLLFCLLGVIIISSIKLGRTKKIRSKLSASDETITTVNESSPVSSDSSEFLIATDSKMGYGAITRL